MIKPCQVTPDRAFVFSCLLSGKYLLYRLVNFRAIFKAKIVEGAYLLLSIAMVK
jgi:hypothetical protein